MRNNPLIYRVHPLLMMIPSLGFMFGSQMVDYHRSPVLKHAMWAGFLGCMSFSMAPLVAMAGSALAFDAMLATGVSMGCLGAVAYNAPSE